MNYEIKIDKEIAGTRADAVLAESIPDVSRSFIQKLFEQDGVELNGTPCPSKKYKAKDGDIFRLTFPEPKMLEVMAELKDCADTIAETDIRMLAIREKIRKNSTGMPPDKRSSWQ